MQQVADGFEPGRRVKVERGIYRQANGKYAVCFMLDGKPRFRPLIWSWHERSARRLFGRPGSGALRPLRPRCGCALGRGGRRTLCPARSRAGQAVAVRAAPKKRRTTLRSLQSRLAPGHRPERLTSRSRLRSVSVNAMDGTSRIERGKGPTALTTEVLYFHGCPNHEHLLEHLEHLLPREGVDAESSRARRLMTRARGASGSSGRPRYAWTGATSSLAPLTAATTGSGAACTKPETAWAESRPTNGSSTLTNRNENRV